MNMLERLLYKQLMSGDEKLIDMFECYVRNMGHSPREARTIVESILSENKELLAENTSFAEITKCRGKTT